MLWFAWECTVNVLETTLFYLFLELNLNARKGIRARRAKQSAMLIGMALLICIMNYFDVSSSLSIGVTCILDVVIAVLFYQNTRFYCVFWGYLFSVICILSDTITVLIPSVFFGSDTAALLMGGELRVPATFLYLALIAVIVFALSLLKKNNFSFSVIQKIVICCAAVVGMILANYILLITMQANERYHDASFTASMSLVNVFFLALFLLLLFYICRLGISNRQIIDLMEKEKMFQLEELEYQTLIKSTTELREMKHDMEEHLNVIEQLASTEKQTELMEYVRSYSCSLEQIHPVVTTGNAAIDCILSSKLSECKQIGIQYSYSVLLPEKLPVDLIPLSSLLSNIWNNAIDACKKIKNSGIEEKPEISFYIKPFHEMMLIHIENRYIGDIKKNSKGEILSSKTEKGHGIGLKRISKIVDEAEGILNIEAEGGKFTVHIMLPLKENENEDINRDY